MKTEEELRLLLNKYKSGEYNIDDVMKTILIFKELWQQEARVQFLKEELNKN